MRRVAPSFTNLQFIGSRLIAMAAMVAALSTYGFASEGANVRIASFDTQSGETFFAASVQPSANDDLLDAVRSAEADVVVVVDTSASQVGDFRYQSIAALNGVLKRLRSGDRVRIFACDVQATALGSSFDVATGQSTASAIAQLNKRLPLGNTNLVGVVDTVRAALISQPRDRTRSIVYIGDGASIDATGNNRRFGALVDALRSDQIAVHSIVIGPTTNVQLMAILANQTGGVLGVVGNDPDASPEVIARTVGGSSVMSPLWLSETKLISGMKAVHGDRMPPLRLDRDSIFLGKVNGDVKQGQFLLTGSTSQSTVRVAVDCKIESSHPDFAFLPGVVKDAAKNSGLTLPTANSSLLREVARVRTLHAEQLVRAGSMALQQGNKEGAKAVAAMALEADPNNQDAISLEKISGNRLVMQNPGDSPFDDIFGGQSAPAPAAGGGADPFGESAPPAPTAVDDDPFGAPAPAAGGNDPFGAPEPAMEAKPMEGKPMAMEDKPMAMEAEAAPMVKAAPADPGIVDTIPRGNAQPFGNNQFGNNQLGIQAIPQGFGPVPGDNELLGAGGGDLLRRVDQERTAAEGRLRAEVNAKLKWATRMLRTNPVNVSKQLKQVLSNVQTTTDINPQLRDDLESQLRSAIQFASRREAEFLEEQVNREEQFEAATATARLLEETFRREATLDTL